MKSYYTLLVKYDNTKSAWHIAFGDYDKQVVSQECDDSYIHEPDVVATKIIRTGDKQVAIEQAVKLLNEKE